MSWLMAIVKLLGGWRATAFACLAVVALVWGGVQSYRVGVAEGALAKVARKLADDKVLASESARRKEREHAAVIAGVAETYEQEKRDAQAKHDAVVAGLRAGTLRLRKPWRCDVPGAGTAAGERDATTDDRAEAAARIVRIGADADAQLRACQAIVEADRQ